MSGFPRSPRLLKGGIALLDPTSGMVQRIVPLQYNPDTISRTLQVQDMGESGNRADVLRLKGPAIETITIEAEIDLTDQMERGDRAASDVGLQPQLAALEIIVQPTSQQLRSNNALADAGTLEIVPMETALAVFIWSKTRVMPVKITEFSITEEAFDPSLNPIRAKVNLSLRVLSVGDLGFQHRGGTLFMTYLEQKERLAARTPPASFAPMTIKGL
jgi:hypothetical protein